MGLDQSLRRSERPSRPLLRALDCEFIAFAPVTVGAQYSFAFEGQGGKTPDTFSAGDLPPGPSLQSSGALAGTPSSEGTLMTFWASKPGLTCFGHADSRPAIHNRP